MKRRINAACLAVALAASLCAASSAHAATLTGGFSVQVSCTDFTATLGTFTATRDNTGSGTEAYYYEVIDGAGTLVARYPASGTYFYPYPSSNSYGGVTLNYNIAPPSFNPLTVRWVSPAGNGEPEQIFYQNTGTCSGLQTYDRAIPALGTWGLALLLGLLLAAGALVLRR